MDALRSPAVNLTALAERVEAAHFPDSTATRPPPPRQSTSVHTVEPLNKGHLGTQAAVPYSEVVPYWEVRDKTVILCTFTASMMYKTHYGIK